MAVRCRPQTTVSITFEASSFWLSCDLSQITAVLYSPIPSSELLMLSTLCVSLASLSDINLCGTHRTNTNTNGQLMTALLSLLAYFLAAATIEGLYFALTRAASTPVNWMWNATCLSFKGNGGRLNFKRKTDSSEGLLWGLKFILVIQAIASLQTDRSVKRPFDFLIPELFAKELLPQFGWLLLENRNIWSIINTTHKTGFSLALFWSAQRLIQGLLLKWLCPISLIYCSSMTGLKSLHVFMTRRCWLGVISSQLEKVGYFGTHCLKDRSVFSNDWLFPMLFGEMCFLYHTLYQYSFRTVQRISIIFPSLHYLFLITFFCLVIFFS